MSKQGFLAIAATVAAGAGLVACVLNGPANEPLPPGAAHVEMGLLSFSPKNLTIRRGETVQWRNISIFAHTVTNNAGPPGGAPFESGEVPAGQVYFQRFDVPGTYPYICRYHADDGMVGSIIVTP
jgi:plastocyanin